MLSVLIVSLTESLRLLELKRRSSILEATSRLDGTLRKTPQAVIKDGGIRSAAQAIRNRLLGNRSLAENRIDVPHRMRSEVQNLEELKAGDKLHENNRPGTEFLYEGGLLSGGKFDPDGAGERLRLKRVDHVVREKSRGRRRRTRGAVLFAEATGLHPVWGLLDDCLALACKQNWMQPWSYPLRESQARITSPRKLP